MPDPLYRVVKRAIDVVVALAVLIVLAPVLIGVGLAIRLTMGPPVLFRQRRPGKNGEIFELVKFRSMASGQGSDADRLTSLGRLLRSTSLDELPSMINILCGDMSLVGPRPLLEEYLPLYSDHHARRHEMAPGLTGLAQVSGRNLLSWDDRLDLDIAYVDSASLTADARILFTTLRKVVERDGISAEGEATMAKFTGSRS